MKLAFTTRIPFAVLIILGVKKWENRSCCPHPVKGRCGMSVSISSDEREYEKFVAFVRSNGSARLNTALPVWDQVKDWRGNMIAEMDYECSEIAGPAIWNEGYRYWWKLSNVKMLDRLFPVRGDVGMWNVAMLIS